MRCYELNLAQPFQQVEQDIIKLVPAELLLLTDVLLALRVMHIHRHCRITHVLYLIGMQEVGNFIPTISMGSSISGLGCLFCQAWNVIVGVIGVFCVRSREEAVQ